MSASPRLISVVVPIYFEEELIGELYRRLDAALAALAPRYTREIVFVNDGSTDGSLEQLVALAEKDASVRVVDLSRNFGHQLAITAGIDAAEGDAVVVIDGDLQDPPEVIEQMVAKWEQGYGVVYGQRVARAGESAFKLATARLFYRLLNSMSEVDLPLDAGDFRLMDRRVVDALVQMREEGRYVRGMVAWIGFKQFALPYSRDARYAGDTKYTLRKMLRLALAGLTSFSSRPLMLATSFGLVITAAAFLYLVFIIGQKLLRPETLVQGWASLTVIVLFLGGVQLLSIGVLGDYIARIFHESKRRPLYVVAERYGFAHTAERGLTSPAAAHSARPPVATQANAHELDREETA